LLIILAIFKDRSTFLEAKTNYTMVGLAVLILTVGLITTALWLSVGFDQKKYLIYAVHIHEAVSGLSEESPVKYNGVQVGSVLKISLSHVDPQEVILLLNIVAGTPITQSTSATLISQGITGTTYVGLSSSSSDLTPLKKLPQEPYPIIPSKPSLFNQLDSVLKEVSVNVNKVSNRVNAILSKENAANIKKSLANLEKFSSVVSKHDQDIGKSLHNLAIVSEELPATVRQLKQNANRLTNDLAEAGKNVSSAMTAGKSAINKFSAETVPPAVTLLRKLNNIASNLEKISSEMRQNPAVVLRGTTAPSPGPGEKK
jgi:phospholipid/cholesterol/gamma-HCH transport system substrate-binding protein